MGGLPELAGILKMLDKARLGLCFSENKKLCGQMEKPLDDLLLASGLNRLLIILNILSELVDAIDSAKVLSCSEHAPIRDEKNSLRINRVYDYVYAHIGEKITLDDAAKVACMSPAAFSSYFKCMTNRNFSHFVGELRISHACRMLRETNFGISEIAYEVGFRSLSSFNRLFKQLKGMSPREFRAKAK